MNLRPYLPIKRALLLACLLTSVGCSERENSGNGFRDFSGCKPASKFVADLRSELSGQFEQVAESIEESQSDSIYSDLFSITDRATEKIANCQIYYAAKDQDADCGDCLKDFYLQVKSVRSYLTSKQIGREPVRRQDIELIRLQIESR
jgi:hypothetical protein